MGAFTIRDWARMISYFIIFFAVLFLLIFSILSIAMFEQLTWDLFKWVAAIFGLPLFFIIYRWHWKATRNNPEPKRPDKYPTPIAAIILTSLIIMLVYSWAKILNAATGDKEYQLKGVIADRYENVFFDYLKYFSRHSNHQEKDQTQRGIVVKEDGTGIFYRIVLPKNEWGRYKKGERYSRIYHVGGLGFRYWSTEMGEPFMGILNRCQSK